MSNYSFKMALLNKLPLEDQICNLTIYKDLNILTLMHYWDYSPTIKQ